MKSLKLVLVALFSIVFLGCSSKNKSSTETKKTTMFQLLSEEESGVSFKNQLSPNYDVNIVEFDYFYNGGGVALGDVNNDGLTDVFLTGNMVPSALYINKGNLKFVDVTETSNLLKNGWATGAVMTDINADGLLDIYVCFSGIGEGKNRRNSFYINQGLSPEGVPIYKDMAFEMGLADEGFTTQAAFFDYDKDGDLDVYLLTALHDKQNPNYPKKKQNNGESESTDRLFRNDGISKNNLPQFTNVSKEAGITYEGYGLGVAINDINQDGWEDIYVANDFIFDDLLYINQGDGTFKEEVKKYTQHNSRFSMGCDMADINNDDLVDIMVLDMLPEDNHRQKMMSSATSYEKYRMELNQGYSPQYSRNMLQLNRGKDPDGNTAFSEIGYLAGIYKTDWSWAPLLVDFDNDGYKDIYITNGIPKDITNNDYIAYRDSHINPNADYDELKKDFLSYIERLPDTYFSNYIYRNQGKDTEGLAYTFENVSEPWGLSGLTCSNGAAFADLDNDGDLDLVVNNVNDRAFVYKSHATEKGFNWLRLKLNGPPGNSQGLGAKVKIKTKNESQYHHQYLARGFQSCQESIVHFGLGEFTEVDTLEVVWPDGKSEKITKQPSNTILSISYKNALDNPKESIQNDNSTFTDVTKEIGIDFVQVENDFDEFKAEFLIPHQYSKSGPGIAVGDVNGDGHDDFVVGGAYGKPTQLFIQKPNGKFIRKDIDANPNREDMGLLLFDCDNDNDLDLYIVGGGSEFMANTPPYQDRLLLNDGQGNFKLDTKALPKIYTSGSCVTAADYDKDGDLDLFVGGRIEAGKYPIPVRSYLLRNEGGRFVDVTGVACNDMLDIGLVTSAIWTDFDNDQDVDLIVAGEWMPISFLRNDQGHFTNVTAQTGISDSVGWWNSLAGGDFDNDGDIDYIAGNLGLNSNYSGSKEEPLSVYAKDFDNNGSIDPIITLYTQGRSHPVAGRDELANQMTIFTKKKFRDYMSYADVTIQDVFSAEQINGSYQAHATHFCSSYIENMGNGKFKLHQLPTEAQFAPIYGMLVKDVDGDGNLDVLLTGNSGSTNYMTGRYDAFKGLLLQGDGQNGFISVALAKSGFWATGDQKSMAEITTSNDKSLIITLANSGPVKVFKNRLENVNPIKLEFTDVYADIKLEDGTVLRKEFYYGSGYLSQSSRFFSIPKNAVSVSVYNSLGQMRSVPLNKTNSI